MAALVLALLMSQAYSEYTVIDLNTNQKLSYEIDGVTLKVKMVWTASTLTGKFFAIALGAKNFDTAKTDAIVCHAFGGTGGVFDG